MATAKKRKSTRGGATGKRKRWPYVLVAIALIGLAVYFVWGETIGKFTETGASYGARVACSCVHVGGRELEDCRKDFESGMELAMLSEDPEAKSVTVTLPPFASQTATYREGYGCVLERWED